MTVSENRKSPQANNMCEGVVRGCRPSGQPPWRPCGFPSQLAAPCPQQVRIQSYTWGRGTDDPRWAFGTARALGTCWRPFADSMPSTSPHSLREPLPSSSHHLYPRATSAACTFMSISSCEQMTTWWGRAPWLRCSSPRPDYHTTIVVQHRPQPGHLAPVAALGDAAFDPVDTEHTHARGAVQGWSPRRVGCARVGLGLQSPAHEPRALGCLLVVLALALVLSASAQTLSFANSGTFNLGRGGMSYLPNLSVRITMYGAICACVRVCEDTVCVHGVWCPVWCWCFRLFACS